MLIGLIIGILSFFIFMFGKLIYFHLVSTTDRAKIILLFVKISLFFQLLVLTSIFVLKLPLPEYFIHGGMTLGIIWSLITSFSLLILYMPFFYVVTSALSIQSLIIINNMPSHTINLDKLKEQFISIELIEERLQAMCVNRYLTHNNGYYQLTSKGKKLAFIFQNIKQLLHLGSGG